MDNSTKKKSSGVVLKAGIWYTVSNFVFRGMAFITTPVFTRLLTKGEYGDFSNFASWMSILVIITSCDLQTSIIRSKLEFEDDALRAIAEKAVKKNTGARALRAIIEEFMLDIMYEIPKDDSIGEVVITRSYIEGTGGPVIMLRGQELPQLEG